MCSAESSFVLCLHAKTGVAIGGEWLPTGHVSLFSYSTCYLHGCIIVHSILFTEFHQVDGEI